MSDSGRLLVARLLVRGISLAVLVVLLRILQGLAVDLWETRGTAVNATLVTVFALTVAVWAVADGRTDAARHRNPRKRDDLVMIWLLAGLCTGAVSSLASWVIGLFYSGFTVAGIVPELTTIAAAVALLMFGPAMAGTFLGHRIVDRKAPPPKTKISNDVFKAVREESSAG